jgi:hypothetical protein
MERRGWGAPAYKAISRREECRMMPCTPPLGNRPPSFRLLSFSHNDLHALRVRGFRVESRPMVSILPAKGRRPLPPSLAPAALGHPWPTEAAAGGGAGSMMSDRLTRPQEHDGGRGKYPPDWIAKKGTSYRFIHRRKQMRCGVL